MIRLPKDTEITLPLLQELLDEHSKECGGDIKKWHNAYMGKHDILFAPAKPKHKPDNRIVVNFAKFIVDTTVGFFIGNPIKTVCEDKGASEYVEFTDQYNAQDDKNYELAKMCSIYGKGYEVYYTDEESEQCTAVLSPLEAFMVCDDTLAEKEMFFIRRYTDRDGNEFGEVQDKTYKRQFAVTGGVRWLDEWQPHYYRGVPATEYSENKERQSVFAPVLNLNNAYNKALSEAADSNEYFADAYLKILGPKLEDGDTEHIRDNRIINFEGEFEPGKIVVEFMDRPSNDAAQEHFLDRTERLIFHIGQTANVSDENFGTNSGIAMLYKIWSTTNIGKTKTRKFENGLRRRYKLMFGHPASKAPADAWTQLKFQFTPNVPENLLEEAQIAAQLDGVVSRKTQLKTLSVVDNVDEEIEALDKEAEEAQKKAMETMMFAADNRPDDEEGLTDEVDG